MILYFYQKGIDTMLSSTISSKFQVAIPKRVREQLSLKAGTRVHVIPYRDRIEFIPVRPMKSMRGFIKRKFSSAIIREKDRV